MSKSFTPPGNVGEFHSVALDNGLIRVVVIPELGGRVWQLEDRIRGREWIWHRDDVPLGRADTGASYDEVWAGGWEELFPNDAPGVFEGRSLPDHGEWWTLPWDVAECSDERLKLVARSSVVKATCSKEYRLARGEARVSVTYRILSNEERPFHFLFKQHLPVRLSSDCSLSLPGGIVTTVDPEFGSIVRSGERFLWPRFAGDQGRSADLSLVRPKTSEDREFVYVSGLPEPWCGVDDHGSGASLRMEFDADAFPFVWLFISYGGWRGVNTVVLEPCTNMPKDLAEAVRLGQSARLQPGQEFVTTVSVSLSECRTTSPFA